MKNINDLIINSESSLKLLEIEIDSKLSFEQHVSILRNKEGDQLNTNERTQKYMCFKEREVLLNSFVCSNLNYCPLA